MMILALLTALWTTSPSEPLTEAEFRKHFRTLIPRTEAAWQTIPWETDLLLARELAQRTNKPIFMWAMNGHPLGCV